MFIRKIAFLAVLAQSLLSGAAMADDAPATHVAAIRERLLAAPRGDIFIVAHRSCWKEAQENSIAGIQACIALGVDAVENDVRHTKDGVAVVMHDETVDRMTNGHGAVASLTLAQIKQLRLKQGRGGDNASLSSETVPTLQEYLEATRGKIMVVMDVKDGSQVESYAIAQKMGLANQLIYFFECKNDFLLSRIRGFKDQVVTFPILFGSDGDPAKMLASCGAARREGLVHVKFTDFNYLASTVAALTGTHRRIWVATMFPEDTDKHDDAHAMADGGASWGALISGGANMIMTNEPRALQKYIQQH